MYDYLIVGSGLFGAVFAHEAKNAGKSVLVIERRDHVGGNIYCEEMDGINVHKYGAHIFHTSYKDVWGYVNQFVEFNNYVNSPVANYKGELQNLEEQAISLVGTDIYTKLIKGYTEKQWGRSCTELPAFIIKRLPVRYTFDNNYFNDRYQGIPVGGYNKLIDALLDGIEVRTGVDYNESRAEYEGMAQKVVYTGPVDAYFDYKLGQLEYRGLRFETERLEEVNHQGVAVMNYTEREVPYTRVIEHKHFEFCMQPVTYVTKEYPADWQPGEEAYYPVNNERNQKLYQQYADLAAKEENVIFGGRLAEYKYYDMDDVIKSALECAGRELQ
jgi:UDP-galactopyranose mutase